jgi:hypothetical protein
MILSARNIERLSVSFVDGDEKEQQQPLKDGDDG